jgi:hypothetical protein
MNLIPGSYRFQPRWRLHFTYRGVELQVSQQGASIFACAGELKQIEVAASAPCFRLKMR